MDWLLGADWETILVPQTPLAEILVRGTLVYLGVFVLLRVVFKRQSGTVEITDLIVVVFIADASQNAMADDYRSIPDGLLLVAVIVGWAFAFDWASYRYRWVERLIRPHPLLLVREGKLLTRNMKKELLTPDELMSHLRLEGIKDVSEVKEAFMEPNGQISVVPREGDPPDKEAG